MLRWLPEFKVSYRNDKPHPLALGGLCPAIPGQWQVIDASNPMRVPSFPGGYGVPDQPVRDCRIGHDRVRQDRSADHKVALLYLHAMKVEIARDHAMGIRHAESAQEIIGAGEYFLDQIMARRQPARIAVRKAAGIEQIRAIKQAGDRGEGIVQLCRIAWQIMIPEQHEIDMLGQRERRPGRGLVILPSELVNQHGEVVQAGEHRLMTPLKPQETSP